MKNFFGFQPCEDSPISPVDHETARRMYDEMNGAGALDDYISSGWVALKSDPEWASDPDDVSCIECVDEGLLYIVFQVEF